MGHLLVDREPPTHYQTDSGFLWKHQRLICNEVNCEYGQNITIAGHPAVVDRTVRMMRDQHAGVAVMVPA